MQSFRESSQEQTGECQNVRAGQEDLQSDELEGQQAQISNSKQSKSLQIEEDSSLENDILDVIQLIESQSSQVEGPIDEEIIFLLGNTGSGKSTLFNWLMGKNLEVKRDQKLKATNWIVGLENDGSTEDSSIGHIQTSTTTIPKIGKSSFGPYLVDFPGWQDTRGWQYDFVNQLVAADLTRNCTKIKILFICDYNVFKTDRGIGIKQLVNNINAFAQGNSIHASAMLVITKLTLEDDPENYIEDIRDHCGDIINNDQQELCDENKTIINSLMKNDIFILEKASKLKIYTDKERFMLWKMIDNLQSSPIILKVYVSPQVNSEFTKYFNNEMKRVKERVGTIILNIGDIQAKLIENRSNQLIEKMHLLINQAKGDLCQQNLNQILKCQGIERLYNGIQGLIKGDQKIYDGNNKNFPRIYNHFLYLNQQIQAYSIEFIGNADFQSLFVIEQNLSEHLKQLDILNQEQVDQEKKENEKILKEILFQKQELERMQKDKKREYNRMRRHIENQNRHFWWFIWSKPQIPDWVEDVDEFIRLGG